MSRVLVMLALTTMLAGCGSDPRDVVWNTVEGIGRGACQAAQSCTNTCPEGERFSGRTNRCMPDR